MKLPLSLIKSYIHLDESLSQISEALTLLGIEVDGIENETAPFSGVCVAEVLETKPHPSAKQLVIATINAGKENIQVVSGAKNCRSGLKTAYAKPGAAIGTRHIEESAIRGVPSYGMLCSEAELGLPRAAEEEEGLIELPLDWKNGEDLLPLLWDPVLELSLTPNLGHCMSALGIARELSLAFNKPIHYKHAHGQAPHFLGRAISDLKNSTSPFWLRQTLLKSGMRPINLIVDITNYLLLKTGQPMHAYDAKKVDGKISVRTTEEEQTFIGIDLIPRTVPKGALIVCDENKTLALAGIMGGADSAVSLETRSIVLEAASFDGLSIRKTARAMGMRTESSQRFEKGTDREAIPAAMEEACSLVLELAGGTLEKEKIEIGKDSPLPKEITLRTARVNQVLGTSLSQNEVEDFVQRLGCKILAKEEQKIHLRIPSYRNDLFEEIDLVEEVARVYGYNNIERRKPVCSISSLPDDPLYLFENEVRKRLAALGLQEILTCDLISPKLSEISPELLYPKPTLLKVLCSKSEEYSILRPSLLAGGLDVIRTNIDQQNLSLAAFEIGSIYFHEHRQVPMCSILLTGLNRPHHWDRKPVEWDYYDLKGMVESLLKALNIDSCLFHSCQHLTFHPGRQANLFHGDLLIGSLGEVHPHLLEKLDIKQRVFFTEINLEHLQKILKGTVRCKQLPQFPATDRDWTYSLPEKMHYEHLLTQLRALHQPLLEKVELIDLYGRNATFRFTYRDPFKTISFEEAEAAHAAIIGALSIPSH